VASLREQITTQVVQALQGVTPAGANVFRSREVSITRDMTPAIVVMPESVQTRRAGQTTDRHELILSVETFVRGDPWDSIAEATAEVAHRVLMKDPVLRGYIADIRRISADYQAQEADRTAGTLLARYAIVFMTRSDDLAIQP
jgi:hypothetical protein